MRFSEILDVGSDVSRNDFRLYWSGFFRCRDAVPVVGARYGMPPAIVGCFAVGFLERVGAKSTVSRRPLAFGSGAPWWTMRLT